MTVQDLGSANGTYVNGDAVEGDDRREVKAGDEIQLGETIMVASSGVPGATGLGPAPTVMGSVPTEVREQGRKSTRNLIIVGVVAVLAAGIAAAIALTRDSGEGDARHRAHPGDRHRAAGADHAGHPGHHREEPHGDRAHLRDALAEPPPRPARARSSTRPQGLIITNNHVAGVGAADRAQRRRARRSPARLIAAMPCEDIALVQITNPADRADFTQVEFADPASLSQGEQVLALGYPGTAATARPEEFANAQLSATERDHLPDRAPSTTCPARTSRR